MELVNVVVGKVEVLGDALLVVELELPSTAYHNDVRGVQPSLDKTMCKTRLDFAKGQNLALEEGQEAEGMDIYHNLEVIGKQPPLGLVGIGSLTLGQKSYFLVQD